jgi:hypothetical protein
VRLIASARTRPSFRNTYPVGAEHFSDLFGEPLVYLGAQRRISDSDLALFEFGETVVCLHAPRWSVRNAGRLFVSRLVGDGDISADLGAVLVLPY